MSDLGALVPEGADAAVEFADVKVMRGEATRAVERVNSRDEERILRSIRNAASRPS